MKPFTALVGIGNLYFYPWDLYLMDANGANRRVILSEVKLASSLNRPPQGHLLAFTGEYEGQNGIWVLDTVSSQVTRVWPDLDTYDWSFDGQQMVIIDFAVMDGVERTHPVIIDVPVDSH